MSTLNEDAQWVIRRLRIEGRTEEADIVSSLNDKAHAHNAETLRWIAEWNRLRVELEDLKALRRRQVETEEVADA